MAGRVIDRREFLLKGAMGAGVLAGLGLFESRADAAIERIRPPARYRQPNIVFIVVDEMRFPSVFPQGINDAGEFLAAFMPNLYHLWANGVKFSRHYSAGVACSPGRASFVSGLYPHQSWMLQTRKGSGALGPPAPAMKNVFPTYGKLLPRRGIRHPLRRQVAPLQLTEQSQRPGRAGLPADLWLPGAERPRSDRRQRRWSQP